MGRHSSGHRHHHGGHHHHGHHGHSHSHGSHHGHPYGMPPPMPMMPMQGPAHPGMLPGYQTPGINRGPPPPPPGQFPPMTPGYGPQPGYPRYPPPPPPPLLMFERGVLPPPRPPPPFAYGGPSAYPGPIPPNPMNPPMQYMPNTAPGQINYSSALGPVSYASGPSRGILRPPTAPGMFDLQTMNTGPRVNFRDDPFVRYISPRL